MLVWAGYCYCSEAYYRVRSEVWEGNKSQAAALELVMLGKVYSWVLFKYF